MNIHPLELTLTGKLLKKAQEFHHLRPLAFGIPFSEYAANPAFVTNLLPLIQATADQWAPSLAQRLTHIAKLTKSPISVPIETLTEGLKSWATNPIHDRTIFVLMHPTRDWMDIENQYTPFRPSDRRAIIQSEPDTSLIGLDIVDWWRQQLEELRDRVNNPKTRTRYILPEDIHEAYRTAWKPNVYGISRAGAKIAPKRKSAPTGYEFQDVPFGLVKLMATWPEVFLHELGHTILPKIPVKRTTKKGPRELHGEISNAAFLREFASILAKRIATEYPNKFSMQMLGQMVAHMLKFNRQILQKYWKNNNLFADLTPITDEVIEAATRLPEFEREIRSVIPRSLKPAFETAYDFGEKHKDLPELLKQRNRFMNTLSMLEAMAGLAMPSIVGHPVEAVFPSLSAILEIVNKMRVSSEPEIKKLHEIAAYGPKSLSEVRDVADIVVSKYPGITQTYPYQTFQKLTKSPGLFGK